ncbi:hypothetical protein [Aureibacillus halotolerans]|uniref:Uncharacterized protein n=1 Tax=Aureibacillus halotolerans TaxID=1508390 RepID=A0A4R6TZ10_9BACI|nr:hypothetical protein [Aureibacillus halotolerans]TDQ39200.1 hypothetical protein EV213_108152 [Aureibacillus halotolerans]
MTTGQMYHWTQRYQRADKQPEPTRTLSLSQIMDDMMAVHRIPMLSKPTYEQKHPQVMQMYRVVADARDFN